MTYAPINSERFGDGQDDTLPASTGLHNHMWDNTKELAVEPRVLCWSPICAQADITFGTTSQQGTKPFAMLNGWLSFLRTKVQIPRGVRSVVVWIAHHTLSPTVVTDSEGSLTLTFDAATKTVQRSSGTWTLDGLGTSGVVTVTFSGTASNNTTFTYVSGVGTDTLTLEEAPTDEVSVSSVTAEVLRVIGELDVRLKLDGVGASPAQTLTQTRLGSSGTPTLAIDKIAMNVEDPSVFGETWLDLAVKSRLGDGQEGVLGQSSNSSMSRTSVQDTATGPVFFENSSSGNPDDDSLEVMVMGVSPATTITQWFDLLGIADKSGKGGTHGSEAWVCGPPWLPFWPSNDEAATLQEVTYMAPRSVAIQFVCDEESVGRIDRAELRPNIITTGSPAGRQVTAVRDLLTRPRLISAGPDGTLSASDTAFTNLGYRRQWPVMSGHQSETALWSKSIRLTTPNPVLRVRQWVACISRNTTGNASGLNKDGKAIFTDVPGRAAWNFRVVVDQLDDVPGGSASWSTDITEYGESTLERMLTITPAYRGNPPLLAQTLEHIFHESGTDKLAYKEGGVSVEYGDDQAMQEVNFEIELSGLDDDLIGRPLRLTLFAEHDTTHEQNDYLKIDDATVGVGPEGWLQLVCGQFSVFEAPQPSEVLTGVRPELFLPGAFVRKTDAAKLNERLEYHWRRAGTVMPGRIYDPPFETTATTYTTSNDASGPDLDTWAGICVLQRNEEDEYELRVQAYLQDMDVRLSLVRFDDRMDSGTFSTEVVLSSSSGAAELVTETLTLTAAQVHEAGSTANDKAPFYCYIAAKHNGAGTGYMWLTPDSREWPAPPVVGAGDPANLAGPTQLFTIDGTADADIVVATGKHVSDGAVIARRLGEHDTHDMYKKISSDLTVDWSNAKTGLLSTGAADSPAGCAVSSDGSVCYVGLVGDGTDYSEVQGNYVLLELDMTDGSINWGSKLDHGGDSSSDICTAGAIAYDETNGQVYIAISTGGDELKLVDDDGTMVAASGNDNRIGNIAAICMSPDDSVVCAIGASEYVGKYSTPLSGTATEIDGGSGGRTNVDGTDTTNAITQIASGDYSGRIEPRRDGSDNTVFFVPGYSTADDPYLMEYDPDETTVANRILTEINVSDDTGLTDLGDGCCVDVTQGNDGKFYVLYLNADSGANAEYDVVRYNSDLTKDLDYRSEPGLTFMDPLTHGLASRITIDEAHNVIVYTRGGWAKSYSQ